MTSSVPQPSISALSSSSASVRARTVVEEMATAMSIASLRNQVIAHNIANRSTEGFARLQVAFDQAWADAPGPVHAEVVAEHAASTPSLEEDLLALSSNTMNYQALTRSLGRWFSILSTITSSGKG